MEKSKIGEIPVDLNIQDGYSYWIDNYDKLSNKTKELIENNKEEYKENHEDRPKSIVSSWCIGAIIGEDDWMKEEEVFLLKTGQIPPKNLTDAMRNGIQKESLAAQKFADEMKLSLFKLPTVFLNDGNHYIAVNIDRLTEDGHIVEIKVPYSKPVTEDEDEEYVLEKFKGYWHQIQLQLHILDIDYAWFVRYGTQPNPCHTPFIPQHGGKCFAKDVLSIVKIPRDPNWWPTHKDKIYNFVDRVLKYNKEKKEEKQEHKNKKIKISN